MYLDLFPHSDTIFCIFKISIYGVQCCCIPLYYRLVKVSHVPHSFCWTPGLQSADLLLWILCEELHLIGTVVQVLSCQTRLISRTFLGENQFSATDAYDHTESYRLHGFCLTITITHQAVSRWNLSTFFYHLRETQTFLGCVFDFSVFSEFLIRPVGPSRLPLVDFYLETQCYLWNFLHRLPVNPFQLISRRPASNLWTIQPFCFCHLPFPPNYTKLHASCAVLTKLSQFHFPCHERHSPWRQVSKGFPTVELWKQIFEI